MLIEGQKAGSQGSQMSDVHDEYQVQYSSVRPTEITLGSIIKSARFIKEEAKEYSKSSIITPKKSSKSDSKLTETLEKPKNQIC